MNKREIVGMTAGLIFLAGMFGFVDYNASREMDRTTLRVRASIEKEAEVYKKLGWKPNYTTMGGKKTGLIGAIINGVQSIGNSSHAYIVTPTEVRYMTEGGLFFDPKQVIKPAQSSERFAVISEDVDIANKGDLIEFAPPGITKGLVLRMIGKHTDRLALKDGDESSVFDNPILNPKGLRKIEY